MRDLACTQYSFVYVLNEWNLTDAMLPKKPNWPLQERRWVGAAELRIQHAVFQVKEASRSTGHALSEEEMAGLVSKTVMRTSLEKGEAWIYSLYYFVLLFW